MVAGGSAYDAHEEYLFDAERYRRLARDSERLAKSYKRAAESEQGIAETIKPLAELGWQVLEDRRWPGSRRANLDFLLVGPPGVVVLDAKDWSDLRVADGHVYCGHADVDDTIVSLRSATDRIHADDAFAAVTRSTFLTVLAFTGRELVHYADGVHLVGERNLAAWLASLPARLSSDEVESVLASLGRICPPMATKPVPRPRDRTASGDQGVLIDGEALAEAMLQAALRGPIEDWMTYLDPGQNKLVTSQWSGPARIRGPAGTGKTVVALHRAVYLAERHQKPVLLVTFVKTLPKVMQALCERLAPSASRRIEFTGLHAFAWRVLHDHDIAVNLSPQAADAAFGRAWVAHGQGSDLEAIDARPSYWKEEIDHVIKGRGLRERRAYDELTRLGRQTPLRAEHRAAMWELYVDYQQRLDAAGAHDFNDVLSLALDVVTREDYAARYSAVIVDEVQDLNLLGLRLLYAIAGDGPDRFLIVGDGQQAVYPGGFTLAEAGINIVGRSAILRRNYRNTVEILDCAAQAIGSDTFSDLDGNAESGSQGVEVVRHGYLPVVVRASRLRDLDHALCSQITRVVAQAACAPGDLAVLTYSRREVDTHRRLLERAGIATIHLEDYDGRTNDAVKVGTFKRAKGLDFKFVLLPRLREEDPEPYDGESAGAHRERVERYRRELFVGMTRASQGLWLSYLS